MELTQPESNSKMESPTPAVSGDNSSSSGLILEKLLDCSAPMMTPLRVLYNLEVLICLIFHFILVLQNCT